MKQRIYLTEDDKLVIVTDNGNQTKDNTTTKVEGVFEVGAADAVRLFGLINGRSLLYKSITSIDTFYSPSSFFEAHIVDTKENINIISYLGDNLRAEKENSLKLYKENEELIRENRNLRAGIEEYNKKRHWWERKLEIE